MEESQGTLIQGYVLQRELTFALGLWLAGDRPGDLPGRPGFPSSLIINPRLDQTEFDPSETVTEICQITRLLWQQFYRGCLCPAFLRNKEQLINKPLVCNALNPRLQSYGSASADPDDTHLMICGPPEVERALQLLYISMGGEGHWSL